MAKSLLLFLSLSLGSVVALGQGSPDCKSRGVRDSLLNAYIERAGKHGFNSEHWDMTLDSLLAICPQIAEAYQEKSLPYLYNGDYETAFRFIDKAVEIDTLGWLGYRAYLKCIFTKNYKRAIIDFAEIAKRSPGSHVMDHTYSFYFGLCYLETGELAKAEVAFLADISDQKKRDAANEVHFNSLFYLGLVYYEMKEFDLAGRYFTSSLQLYPQFPEANYYMWKVLKILGNPSSVDYLTKAKEFFREGYRMNEPNVTYVTFPRQVSPDELERAN